jgi:glyoxylase-like metal-dependent hydrolase (beta-lactamase superfamily II)
MEKPVDETVTAIYALKYGVVEFLPNYAVYWMGDPHYASNLSNPTMFQYFWLIKTATRNILVDVGVGRELAAERKMADYKAPDDLLKRLKLTASDIDTVILTHAHWDHLDAMDYFSKAVLYVQRACYRFTVEEGAEYAFFRRWGYPTRKDSFTLLSLVWDGRLKMIDGDSELFPGIRVIKVDGHFPGLQIVVTETAKGRIIMASDAMHFYDNLERDFPMGLYFGNLRDIVKGYETIRRLNGTIVPGHDPLVFERFKLIDPDIAQIYP